MKPYVGTDYYHSPKIKIKRSHPERKIALLLFSLTILAAVFFWLKTEFSQLWRQFARPATFEIVSPLESLDLSPKEEKSSNPETQEAVIKEIEDLTKNLSGEYAVYIYSFTRKKEYGINQEEIFPAASVNKVPIMLAFYKALEQGKFSPDQEYSLQKEDIEDYGTGIMRYEEPGKVYTYRELLELSGKKSDNTAALVLSKIFGQKNLQDFVSNLGLEKTYIERNETTAEEAGKFFIMTWEGGILKTQKYKENFFNDLVKTDFEERIPAGLPEGVKIAHKIGSEERVYNDCGLVFASKPFVLCILSKEVAENEALEVIPKITGLVWDFEEN